MKKKTTYILLLIFALITSIDANSQSQNYKKSKVRWNQKDTIIGFQRTQVADSLAKVLSTCSENQNCGLANDYCAQQCKEIIRGCHKINDSLFNILTNNMQDGHAMFKRWRIEAVLSDAICGENWIRCYIYEEGSTSYYRIGSVPDPHPTGELYETFYSVPLFQTIYDKEIKSITLYRGTETSTEPHKLVIPFKVIYKDNPPEFYDVSNDLP